MHNNMIQHWQLYVQNLLKNSLVKSLQLRGILTLSHPVLSLSSPLSYLFSKCSSKLPLGLIGVLLLPYSANTQALSALSATTKQIINGSKPYLTFDGGVTKATDTNNLLAIKLSDGTTITPATNTSATTPIKLPNADETLADVHMLIPNNTDSIALSALIGPPYNYWGDDDGDGQGTNGISVTGNLSVTITDKNNRTISRSEVLSICGAPYKMVLTSTDGKLTTKYGIPDSSSFSSSSVTYYFNPKSSNPTICYVRPALQGLAAQVSPSYMFNPEKGFLVQSVSSASYSRNFPTTAANMMYFDLDVAGTGPLTWPAVTKGGITASMAPTPNEPNNVRVTLTGPTASSSYKPSLPQSIELVGYDSSNQPIVKYGFELKHWFINQGEARKTYSETISWCSRMGYRVPQVKDLTNASDLLNEGFTSATPNSNSHYSMRYIGGGFFSEWGEMWPYSDSGFLTERYWTSDRYTYDGNAQYSVYSGYGDVYYNYTYADNLTMLCTYP